MGTSGFENWNEEAVAKHNAKVAAGKTHKLPCDARVWDKMSPEQKKQWEGNPPVVSHSPQRTPLAVREATIINHMVVDPEAKIKIVTRNAEEPGNPTVVSLERQESTDVQKLNKLERSFHNLLLAHNHPYIWVQSIILKLADDTRYICDFIVLTKDGKLIGYETKGHRWAKNMIKLKIAARMFPFIKFVLVSKGDGGVFIYEDVKP